MELMVTLALLRDPLFSIQSTAMTYFKTRSLLEYISLSVFLHPTSFFLFYFFIICSLLSSACAFQGETDAECAAKAAYALEHGISVMGCIGESKEERESG